jgi:FemAB family protein
LQSNGVPVAVWPLGVYRDANGWHLTSSDGPIWPPLLCAALPDKLAKRLVAECLDTLKVIASSLSITELVFANRMLDGRLDLFHQTLMDDGARVTTTHNLGVDLTLDLEDIRLNFRKSYRPLINKGLGTWEAELVSVFEEFRLLHRDVAGRVTRGLATWELQHEALSAQEAFLVTLRDKANARLVGAGYFNVSRTDGLYAVAAYDRALFDLPLGHVVQYKAIEYMKSLGLQWYSIGARPYAGDDPAPSAKEAQIAQFKQGFATHLLPMFTLRLSLTADSAAAPEADGGS